MGRNGGINQTTKAASLRQVQVLLTVLAPRDALAVRLMYETGLRVSDVLNLKRADFAREMTIVEQKTRRVKGKTRTFTMSRKLFKDIEQWIKHSSDDGSGKIFNMNRSTLYRNIRKEADKRGWEHISAHSFRKSFARKFARKHGIKAAQHILGHKYVSTTMLYIYDNEKSEGELENENVIQS